MSAQFNIKAAAQQPVAELSKKLNMPRFVAATLVARGITTPEAALAFMDPSFERDWLNPYTIPGMSEVADALEAEMRAGHRICVFGDFDLDGISATTVLTRGLRALGADCVAFIPHRFNEGYGLSAAAFERVKQYDPQFIVTVDCGIACKEEVRAICAAGVGVAITDHHEPTDLVPEGVPVCDPKCDPACESGLLAGVGVALKLVQVLGGRFGQPHLWRNYIDFATLGTVADLMPMLGENRPLVKQGIALMNNSPRPCIAALLQTSGAAEKSITSSNMSFSLIPRLNAAGRMGRAELALDLLLTDDFNEACLLAAELEELNDQRRAIEAELSEIAQVQAGEVYSGQRVLVVAGEGWHEGVKGIVASRLVGIYGVPCLLFTIDGEEARGSGRSVGQINLFKAVESCADLLTRFGGHEGAVGVTIPTHLLGEFTARLNSYLEALPEGDFHPLVQIDSCVDIDELGIDEVESLAALAPFGQENPVPCYLARDVTLTNCRAVGAEKNHFSCMLSNGRAAVSAIMFHCTDIDALMASNAVVNAAFTLEVDEWRGRRSVKALLKSIAPAKTCPALEACLAPENLSFAADLYATSDAELCEDCRENPDDVAAYEANLVRNRKIWEARAQEDPNGLESAIVSAVIGSNGKLHDSQRVVLAQLRAGSSLLAVMATGRGKSLTFQVHAAYEALCAHKASLFVYPLRALIADQAFHLRGALAPFGINVEVLTGESTPEERRHIVSGLADGSVDIVLTTPEFFDCHAEKFAASRRIGFVVVDEAHHIGLAKAGHREAYANLGSAIERLGQPQPVVLALTATADELVANDIDEKLPVAGHVIDDTARDNLSIDDQRNLKNRTDYLASIVASGEKTVVYVASREQSIAIARDLRKRVPQIAPMIGFYNAGLTRSDRSRIEELFRSGACTVLVATSAFGEGIDIPNIRHVVLYQLPFNEIEFNQMSGRAGRDGNPACVHLLFSRNDAARNRRILQEATPSHDVLAQVYRCLRDEQRKTPGEFFEMGNVELAQRATDKATDKRFSVTPVSAACGVAVFRELGLIDTHVALSSGEVLRMVRVNENAAKVELIDSVRYREGLGEQSIFQAFFDWIMHTDVATLTQRISRPITPNMKPNRR